LEQAARQSCRPAAARYGRKLCRLYQQHGISFAIATEDGTTYAAKVVGADLRTDRCGGRAYRGTAFIKERINLNALKLLESFSRLACH
jgi:hypothetical protein